jgi:hypothetical protein
MVSADCTGGHVCVSGICTVPGAVNKGGACTATRDCAAGLYCAASTGKCAPGGMADTGQPCATDADCKAPLRCALDGLSGSCAAGGTGEPGSACQATADCLAGLWCGRDKTCAPLGQAFPPYAGAACHDEGPFRVYFEVPRPGKPPADFFRLPFPSDIRVTDGKLDISDFPKPGPTPLGVDLVQLYVDTWTSDFDGFSDIGVVTFRLSADTSFATLTGDNVLFYDVTPGSASLGRLLGRSWQLDPGRTKYNCQNRLTVRNGPAEPLEPNHTYAVILTPGLQSATGQAAVADTDLAAVMGPDRPATDAALGHAWDAYKPLRDWLAMKAAAVAMGVMGASPPPAVAAAAVFKVQDAPAHVQRLAADVAKQPAPKLTALTLCGPGVKSPCDDGTPARACGAGSPAFDEVHGKFSVPIYQAGTEPYATPADGGGITETAGAPVLVRTEDVCFALSLPKGTSASAVPPAGWPLVVYHHGTGGSMRSFIDEGIAAKLAGLATPAAGFGFDAVEHGARAGGSTKKPDDLVFNPLNPHAARDNFLQGAVDILQALRLGAVKIDAATSPTGAAIAFDATKVAFFGHSQGSTSGEIALSATGAAPAAILSGAGAFLTASLLDKTSPQNIAAGLSFLLGEPITAEHPVMTLFQSFFDRSDPLSYNQLIVANPPPMVPAKHVYMSWGTGDTYTPKSTLDANARSLGNLPPVGAVLEDYGVPALARPASLNFTLADKTTKRTAVVVQYAPSGYDGHFVALQNPAAVADWSTFLETYLATGTPALQ